MSVICRSQSGELFLFAKGAPEIIMDKCSKIMIADRERDITQDDQDKLRDECAAMTSRALRVMAFAYRTVQPYQLWRDDLESQLVFIGLAGMTDPPERKPSNRWPNADGQE